MDLLRTQPRQHLLQAIAHRYRQILSNLLIAAILPARRRQAHIDTDVLLSAVEVDALAAFKVELHDVAINPENKGDLLERSYWNHIASGLECPLQCEEVRLEQSASNTATKLR